MVTQIPTCRHLSVPHSVVQYSLHTDYIKKLISSCVCVFAFIVLLFIVYFSTYICFLIFSKLLKLRFVTHSTLHSLILLNSEAKIFNTLFY